MDYGSALIAIANLLTTPELLMLLLAGTAIGLFFGIMPGLGGKLGIVFLIPFVFGMDPMAGAVFLLAMHAVVHTSGAIPSILFGIPGTGPDAATIVDGFPMARNGEAGRAIGATLMASAVGGVIGAAFLTLLIPFAGAIVLAFSPAEFFFLAILGITFIAALSGASLLKGLITGFLGLMLSFVGPDPLGAEARFTFGHLFLWEGIDLVMLTIAIFAIPELVALASERREATDKSVPPSYGFRDIWSGCRDTFVHGWLTLRCSVIGAIIGLIPGLGGDVASWISYGHAVQSSRDPGRFGKGAVEGVIAPESANNSKEGGALLPTLYFGIPGSSGMALLLGAFVMLGIVPGSQLMVTGMPLVWALVWTLALSNVIAVAMLLAGAPWLARIASIRASLLIPFVIVLSLAGIYMSAPHWQNLLLVAGFGAIGHLFKKFGWPRSPMMIGLVLGPIAESSLHKALALWGPAFAFRPLSLAMIALIAAAIAYNARKQRGLAHHAP